MMVKERFPSPLPGKASNHILKILRCKKLQRFSFGFLKWAQTSLGPQRPINLPVDDFSENRTATLKRPEGFEKYKVFFIIHTNISPLQISCDFALVFFRFIR
ncbi:MAG: hypothetical protein IKN04_09925 [Clostridia bacterium]|nr:hypothetical protein [Clostridia bacterium]